MSEKQAPDPLRKLAEETWKIAHRDRDDYTRSLVIEWNINDIEQVLREAQDLAVRAERERMRKIIGWEGTNDLDNYEQGLCACCDKPYTHYDKGREVYTCDECGLDKFIEEEPAGGEGREDA